MKLGWIVGVVALAMLAPSLSGAATEPAAATALGLCAVHKPDVPPPAVAPASAILSGYGTGGFAVRAANTKAQAFFDNGMQLGHAFAHKPAIAAFKAAELADPTCAMCAWGEAWSRGPTINYPIDAKQQAELARLADKAAVLAKGGPEKERRLTAALQQRYHDGGGKGPGDDAFAARMDAITRDYPSDNEIAVLAADAWMIPTANRDRNMATPRALDILEAALKRNPNDTGAIHFYIHATEMSGFAWKALPYAEKLQALAPSASHLVHMPSHTYYWVGWYAAAARSNVDAVRLDAANATRAGFAGPGGVWKLDYHGHNVTFGMGAAMIAGDGASALALAGPAIASADPKGNATPLGAAYAAEGRFADAAATAALADPGAAKPYVQGMWRYGRGEAAARAGDAAAVRVEAGQIARISAAPTGGPTGHQAEALQIAHWVLIGRAAMIERNYDAAIDAFRKAAGLQESKLRDFRDPPMFWYPVRRSLAAALLADGQTRAAQTEARTALAAWVGEPMALMVLARAERGLGDSAGGVRDEAAARRGWSGDPAAVPLALI
jgi:tetratricopeptide (TPR) repeat protein